MAIRMRRGSRTNMDPSKLLPGEWAVCTSDDPDATGGKSVYICFASGEVRRVVTTDDLAAAVADANEDAAKEIVDAATKEVTDAEATRQANEATRQATYVKSATATTLSPGSSATATISNNVLTIGVPKGDKGDKGDTGSVNVTDATGTLSLAHGGTGATTAAAARTALGIGDLPVFYYTTKPDESAVTVKPSLAVIADGSVYLVTG